MGHLPIYLDHHATTPLDKRVLDAMMPYLTDRFGNAASRNHVFGWQAEEAVELARADVAELIGADKKEIIFTGGATESINLALKGVAEAYASKGNHIITAVAEHRCVLDSCKHLEKSGFEITVLPVRNDGTVDPEQVRSAITDRTILISVMMANNEIGSINPIQKIGEVAREKNILFHSDIVQAVGKVSVDVNELNLDLASLSAHKFYGPKGVGALFVRQKNPRVKLVAQMDGGGHEKEMRSGTLNVPGIIGLGRAALLCKAEFDNNFWHYFNLRNKLYEAVVTELDSIHLNGPEIETPEVLKKVGTANEASKKIKRLPNNLNISFEQTKSESIMIAMKEVAMSSGSACTSALPEPSHVLRAIGISDELAKASLRFGIGRTNTLEEIEFVGRRLVDVVTKLRSEPQHAHSS
ncbi:aminotransferase class V-fold PLP-dependent enzyme [bacterium]|nr:MAG: aminotransferase class V-fold PLP-dependent enzyme [bacterium]